MTLDQLDQKLASWKTDLGNISTNLTSIEEGVGFKTAKSTQLAGDTDKKCREAFTTVEKLWEYLKLIRDVVEAAEEKRKHVPMVLGRQTAIDEIDTLLNGQSIQLSLVTVPINERGLLGGATQSQTTTPDALKQTMVDAFARANTFFVDIRQRWLDLADIAARSSAELDSLHSRVNALGKPKPAEVSDIEARLAAFDRNRQSNPLSIQPKKFEDEMKGYILKAKIIVQEMEHASESVGVDVERAYTRLEQVRTARIQALDAQKRAGDKLTGVSVEQPPNTKALVDQLETIKTALTAKRFAEVGSGLDAWNREAAKLEAIYKFTVGAMEALLQKAEAIKTRMATAKRQRQDNADKGLNSDKALDKFQEKYDAAAGEKFDIAAAELAVTSYETRVAGLISAWVSAPADVRLKRRLDKAKEDAESHGFAAYKALVSYAKAAEDAIKDGKLDVAENYINSYEVKLGELKVNPPKDAPQATPGSTISSPKVQPAPATDRKTALNDRLAKSKAKAAENGQGDDKVLGKFADKAKELLDKGDLDGAESMVHSHETRQAELAAKSQPEPVKQETKPSGPTVDSLRKRLTDAQSKASTNNVTSKALTAYAQKASELLNAGDLSKAEEMIVSYETRLSEALAHSQK